MPWPAASHFSLSLQNPKSGLKPEHLRAIKIGRDKLGQPRPWSGAFAVVFQGTDSAGRSVALRAFTSEVPERIERYQAVGAFLARQRPRCLVGFQFHAAGIRSSSDGKWYPLVVMDWVPGETLFDWMRVRCLKRDTTALTRAAADWVRLVEELATAGIAHGDLQHANVMMTPAGELKLVDYDCLAVPALMGKRNLEIGVEPYQHPARGGDTRLGPTLDRFSALFVTAALRAFAADPSLWDRHVEPKNAPPYDKLLFRREDLIDPARSTLRRELERSRDAEVPALFRALVEAFRGPLDAVPLLAEALGRLARRNAIGPIVEKLNSASRSNDGRLLVRLWDENAADLNGQPGASTIAPVVQGWRTRNRLCDAFAALARQTMADPNALCSAWIALERAGGHPDAEPLRPRMKVLAERVAAWTAFQSVPRRATEECDEKLVAAWNEGLFAHWPEAERERVRVVQARQRLDLLARLRGAERGGLVVETSEQQLVAGCRQLPSDYTPTAKARAQLAADRLTALARMRDLLRAPEQSDMAIAAAWDHLAAVGGESLAAPAERQRAELAASRKPLIVALRQIPAGVAHDERDRTLLRVWKAELLDGCADVRAWQAAHADAMARYKLLKKIRSSLLAGDDLAAVEGLQQKLLAGYPLPPDWTERVRTAKGSAGSTSRLLQALRANDIHGFAEQWDVATVRRSLDLLAPYRPLLDRWMPDLLARPGGGPALPRHQRPAVLRTPRGIELRWTWPDVRFTETCHVVVRADDRSEPLYGRTVTRADYERAGGRVLLHADPSWDGAEAVVWAEVDLGYRIVSTTPLFLGAVSTVKLRQANATMRVE